MSQATISHAGALQAAKLICAELREQEAKPEFSGPDNKLRYSARGLTARYIETLYYAMPGEARGRHYGYEVNAFFKAAGWPT